MRYQWGQNWFNKPWIRSEWEKKKIAQDHQKKYGDTRRRKLEFEKGDKVFHKVSPTKGVKRFGVRGKLSPKFIEHYEVLRRVGEVAYEIALPTELSCFHNVFHVSQLRKYVHDPSHVLSYEPLQLDETLSYEERSIRVLDRWEKVL